jgi:hypothetical protein
MHMTTRFGDTEDVRTLTDAELSEREKQMCRNRNAAHLLLLRSWKVEPKNAFERTYVEVCNELQRRGRLEVD